jgi:hypothetical protein
MPSLIEHLKPQHRGLVAAAANGGGYVTSVPDNTPKHIIERLTRSIHALIERRSVTAAEERSYQSVAEALAARRGKKQAPGFIAKTAAAFSVPNGKASKRQMITDARALAAKYPELDFETVSRAVRLGYSEDAMNQLRSAAIAQQIRADGGAVADPTQSLRSPQYYRACAAKAKTMSECSRLHKLADEAEKKLAS